MSRPTPEIVTGARDADAVNVLSKKQAQAAESKTGQALSARAQASLLKPGEVEFHCVYGRGIYQITAPADLIDPSTGVRTVARPKKLVFDNGRVLVNDVEIVHRVKGCPGSCGKHKAADGSLAAPHPKYGLGNEFWDAEEAFQRGETKRIDDAVNVAVQAIEADPAVAAQILERLGLKSFEVPARPKAGKEAEAEA